MTTLVSLTQPTAVRICPGNGLSKGGPMPPFEGWFRGHGHLWPSPHACIDANECFTGLYGAFQGAKGLRQNNLLIVTPCAPSPKAKEVPK